MDVLVPTMLPAPGERVKRFVGDRIRFKLTDRYGRKPAAGWRAVLRTNLGRGKIVREEIVQAHARGLPPAGASWRDIPMTAGEEGWSIEMPLAEPGYFQAKAYLLDPRSWQHWPEGGNAGISVHPDQYRTGNIVYCAFTRMFGPTRVAHGKREDLHAGTIDLLDRRDYTIIPPSGKLRDLQRFLPHIFDTLGCRILQLLPINPAPTTYARFGRYGSPYAALDLTAIDPALVVFDKRTTGVDQFRELAYDVHARGGRLFLDIVINHTGWGSALQENRPEWFLKHPDGQFASPGAWGNTWEDLVELKHVNVELWDELAEMLLTWCRRGVDGFRCDAGYKVPVAAWQYIVARVQQHFPETIFLLEGLGGAWEATEALLTDGGMQWAYSELFQNYSGQEVSSYLDHSLKASERAGLLVNYSETHDNPRLAARGRLWSLLRNRLCALTSVSGGFAFTCGVEWLATEAIRVHESHGLSWDNPDNIVPELAALDRLLAEHPCFFEGASVQRLSPAGAPVFALWRQSEEGKDAVLVLVNTDPNRAGQVSVNLAELAGAGLAPAQPVGWSDLLGQPPPVVELTQDGSTIFYLAAGATHCLSANPKPVGLHGNKYREARARAAWAISALNLAVPAEEIGAFEWRRLGKAVDRSPAAFLAKVAGLTAGQPLEHLSGYLEAGQPSDAFPQVVTWTMQDCSRVLPVPPDHWLLIQDPSPFRANLSCAGARNHSIPAGGQQIACFPPGMPFGPAKLVLERYASNHQRVEAQLHFLAPDPQSGADAKLPQPSDLVLLTNGRGAMARIGVDLGRVASKYDCVLGANLHPDVPVDRHVFVKRIRVWVNADGFISPLDFHALASFQSGPPATWNFLANAGDGRTVEIQMTARMDPGRNTVVFEFRRPTAEQARGRQLPGHAEVRLTVRLDIEDRNFHWETKHNSGAEHHFRSNTHAIKQHLASGGSQASAVGFAFTPAADRQLHVTCSSGLYHPQPEWSFNIAHPVEQSRGQEGSGDSFSPGWFEVPLPKGARTSLTISAEGGIAEPPPAPEAMPKVSKKQDAFSAALLNAAQAFIVRRGAGKTIIAGYPWFLDWGRDTLICARGLLAAGLATEVRDLLLTYARFEQAGTLPNTIHGESTSNRDTSDAPLFFALVCEEFAEHERTNASQANDSPGLYSLVADQTGRTVRDVLESIARNYLHGTANGIRVDQSSGLVWSPSHFTWMDTNYPAATPREGYPIEIQALWIRLLRQLQRTNPRASEWQGIADLAETSLQQFFWLEDRGWYADVLVARSGGPARQAAVDDALRSNCLFPVTLHLASRERARRCVDAVMRHLVVPGALRSLAPLPVSMPLPIYAADGRLLNNPNAPYWGRYEGDEDTRRKPAYHNGTAWVWTFPMLCEALALAWDYSPAAVRAARAYLGSVASLLKPGCIGHLPEVLDGDAPHTERGCDAQSWSATEALRVWLQLTSLE